MGNQSQFPAGNLNYCLFFDAENVITNSSKDARVSSALWVICVWGEISLPFCNIHIKQTFPKDDF